MRESRTSGFVRGAHSNMCPYRDPYLSDGCLDGCPCLHRQGRATTWVEQAGAKPVPMSIPTE